MGKYALTDPGLHAIIATHQAPAQAIFPLEQPDPTLAPGPKALETAKPGPSLFIPLLQARFTPDGNTDLLDATILQPPFVLTRIETPVAGHRPESFTKQPAVSP